MAASTAPCQTKCNKASMSRTRYSLLNPSLRLNRFMACSGEERHSAWSGDSTLQLPIDEAPQFFQLFRGDFGLAEETEHDFLGRAVEDAIDEVPEHPPADLLAA